MAEICIIEPFFGGSHKQLIDLLQAELTNENCKYDLFTLPDKKWHWRARCSALHFSQVIHEPPHNYKILFASSVLNLAELIGIRPDLAKLQKIIYFHENQLTYPVQNKSTRNTNIIENKEQRDFQYGYNQILTCLAADKVIFNSLYNKTSFLNNISSFLKKVPEKPRLNIKSHLEPKCSVLYFPIKIDQKLIESTVAESVLNDCINMLNNNEYLNRPLGILWPHRWEHDKNPEEFFNALIKLNEMNIDFKLHVVGEMYSEIPEIFEVAKEKLKSKIVTWGYLPSKMDYFECLSKCDIIVSTSLHEFFGVAVIESCLFGAYPLLPNRLAYPELFPKENLYSTEAQLVKKLKYFCSRPSVFRLMRQNSKSQSNSTKISEFLIDKPNYFDKYKWESLRNEYMSLFKC